jgi:hypothetical protein
MRYAFSGRFPPCLVLPTSEWRFRFACPSRLADPCKRCVYRDPPIYHIVPLSLSVDETCFRRHLLAHNSQAHEIFPRNIDIHQSSRASRLHLVVLVLRPSSFGDKEPRKPQSSLVLHQDEAREDTREEKWPSARQGAACVPGGGVSCRSGCVSHTSSRR